MKTVERDRHKDCKDYRKWATIIDKYVVDDDGTKHLIYSYCLASNEAKCHGRLRSGQKCPYGASLEEIQSLVSEK